MQFDKKQKQKNKQTNKKIAETILLDLSKAFDCISHDRLKAKINAHGFDKEMLSF